MELWTLQLSRPSKHKTFGWQNFVRCWANAEEVGATLYKWLKNKYVVFAGDRSKPEVGTMTCPYRMTFFIVYGTIDSTGRSRPLNSLEHYMYAKPQWPRFDPTWIRNHWASECTVSVQWVPTYIVHPSFYFCIADLLYRGKQLPLFAFAPYNWTEVQCALRWSM